MHKFLASRSWKALCTFLAVLIMLGSIAFSYFNPLGEGSVLASRVQSVACLVMGLLVGALVRGVVAAEKALTIGTATAALSLVSGAAVLGLFQLVQGKNAQPLPDYWYYPIGVALGFFIIAIGPGKSTMWPKDEDLAK